MKKIIIGLLIVLVLILSVRFNELENQSSTEINIRSKANLTGDIISTIKHSESVKVVKTYNDWVKISYLGNVAFTYRELLTSKSLRLFPINIAIPIKLSYEHSPKILFTDEITIQSYKILKYHIQIFLLIIILFSILFSVKKVKIQQKNFNREVKPTTNTVYVSKPEIKTVYVEKKVYIEKEKPLTQLEKNWQAGHDFEDYIIDKLNSDYNRLIHRNCDSITDGGVYAANMLHPDLKFRNKNTSIEYTIECKYSKFDNIKLDDHKLQRYKKHGAINNQKVYIALGTGGKPKDPQNLYIIPTYRIKNNKQLHQIKEEYRKKDLTKRLAFNEKFLIVV